MSRTLSYQELSNILPHAYPFLLIDRVDDYKENEYLIASKNITANEWPFAAFGHKQQGSVSDIYPETLLIEAAAQAAVILYKLTKMKNVVGKYRYVLGKIKVAFFSPVYIGDTVQVKINGGKILDTGGYFDIAASVGNNIRGNFELFFSVKKTSF